MSATTAAAPSADQRLRLDLAEQIARIERSQEETRKFVAERDKLLAEAGKLNRDRFLAFGAIGVALLAAIGGVLAGLPTIIKLWKGVPL